MEKEPTAPVEIDGEVFTVADQKALLLLAYEKLDPKTYEVFGERFNGD